ncbi:RNA polymerase sigma factor [Ottowia sp.]|uniref:RNA polymerase sigma factor n=1 Tax=Ottowia sp. TaxID=1898956 RepID=UPI0039E5C900
MGSSLLSALVRHYDELANHLRRRFGTDHALACEVVHEVCIDLLEKPREAPVRQPLALLRRMSRDKAVDRFRAEDRRRQWLEHVAEPPEVACPAPDAATLIDARREFERLAEAIERLPRRCRLVFVMHKVYEIPQDEVARRLGISRKTVEKHLRAGMACCRAHMGREARA